LWIERLTHFEIAPTRNHSQSNSTLRNFRQFSIMLPDLNLLLGADARGGENGRMVGPERAAEIKV
jgi:hypothetical protein